MNNAAVTTMLAERGRTARPRADVSPWGSWAHRMDENIARVDANNVASLNLEAVFLCDKNVSARVRLDGVDDIYEDRKGIQSHSRHTRSTSTNAWSISSVCWHEKARNTILTTNVTIRGVSHVRAH